MIDSETPLAEIVGQIFVKEYRRFDPYLGLHQCRKHDLTKLARWLYTHKRRELMAGDEVSRNNVVEGDANNRSDVYYLMH